MPHLHSLLLPIFLGLPRPRLFPLSWRRMSIFLVYRNPIHISRLSTPHPPVKPSPAAANRTLCPSLHHWSICSQPPADYQLSTHQSTHPLTHRPSPETSLHIEQTHTHTHTHTPEPLRSKVQFSYLSIPLPCSLICAYTKHSVNAGPSLKLCAFHSKASLAVISRDKKKPS